MLRTLVSALGATIAFALPARAAVAGSHAAASPAVFPLPHSVAARAERLTIPPSVRLVTTRASDPAAVRATRSALAVSGVVTFSPTSKLSVFVGRNTTAEQSLGVSGARGLPAGGYVLAVGRGRDGRARIVLDGADRSGQFYAAQTLRQLLEGRRSVQGVVVRDWPSFPSRGVVEGFYGTPWSQAERLSALDFLGEQKLNVYMYGPKDDPFLRARWDAPFTLGYLARMSALQQRAAGNHVRFDVVLSPGLSICYSAPADQAKLLAKIDALWNVGVRSFTVAFDDLDPARTPCASDTATYGTGLGAVASAQAALANAVSSWLAAVHGGASRLVTVPMEYNGIVPTEYTEAFARALAPGIVVQWTGRYGISVAISADDAKAAVGMFRHPILAWDNYYVTDYAKGFLALGPLDRHDALLPQSLVGLVADPMEQPESSRLGLFTVADYTWNAAGYDATRSWNGSVRGFAAGDRPTMAALRIFGDANWGALLSPVQAPSLRVAIAAFWSAWSRGDGSSAAVLDARFREVVDAPAVLRARLDNPFFLREAAPWLDATQAWGRAARMALAQLVATSEGNVAAAAASERQVPLLVAKARSFSAGQTAVQVAPGVLDQFIVDARVASGGSR